jgi:hypothetical protein
LQFWRTHAAWLAVFVRKSEGERLTVVSWRNFSDSCPDVAALGLKIFSNYGIAYLATIRPDGGPRITPVSPAVIGDGLYLGLMPATPKRKDLDRDARCTLHGLPGPQDAEVSLYCAARKLEAAEVAELFKVAPDNVRLARDTYLYELSINRADCTVFQGETAGLVKRPKPERSTWRAPRCPANA